MHSNILNTYNRLPISFSHGSGVWLHSTNGEKYFDALCGIAVTGLGHNNKRFNSALKNQIDKGIHYSNLFRINEQEVLAEKLTEISDLSGVFFCNSGCEANEAAIKLARLYGSKNNIKNPTIIVFEDSFHGRTMATLSATSSRKAQKGFEPLLSGFLRMPKNEISKIESLDNNSIVAILLEPIQGEGGIKHFETEFLSQLRLICEQKNWLFIADEVQCGMGRTGYWWSSKKNQIVPDVLTSAKGLGNGFPIGACLTSSKFTNIFEPGNHGSTFGGNPLACVASLETIKIIEDEKLLDNAKIQGGKIINQLTSEYKGNSKIKEIRGTGLMIGIEFHENCSNLNKIALENNVILNITSNNTLRLLPPLIINNQESDFLVDKIIKIINKH